MVRVSNLSTPVTLNVTVKSDAVTDIVAAVILRVPVKVTVPTPGLNLHPVGAERMRVWLFPAEMSVAATSVMTILPRAVKAAPLVELSALSAETLLPPVGEVMVTLAHMRGELNATNPRIRLRRMVTDFMVP